MMRIQQRPGFCLLGKVRVGDGFILNRSEELSRHKHGARSDI